jgi:tetratricopeptide (TPR) repeat protein
VQRAKALVESGPAEAALTATVEQLLAELDEEDKDRQLLAALDAARLAQAETLTAENRFATERALPLFREAFRLYGLPAGEGEASAAAARIRERPPAMRTVLVAALHEWVAYVEHPRVKLEEPHLEWLRAVLDQAEPEGWGKDLREALAHKDRTGRRAALEQLAEKADVAALPPQALTALARRLQSAQANASAVRLLRRSQQLHPGDFWIHEDLGIALLERQKPSEPAEAVRFLTAAVALRPDSPGAHFNLGNALSAQGKLDDAIAAYRQAIALDPKYAPAHTNLGLALSKQGKVDEAIAKYRQAIHIDPTDAHAHAGLGSALDKQGKMDEAIAEYRQAIALDPKDAPAHHNLGLALAEQGKLDEAIAEFRQAIALDPKYAPAHHNLGLALTKQGKVDEAIAKYRQAIALDSKCALPHSNLGAALLKQGKMDEAIAEYRQAIHIDPKDALARNNLGVALAKQGKVDEAIAEFRQTIALDPKDAPAHANLGVALAKQGQLDEAIAEFRKSIELNPKAALVHTSLGDVLDDQGKQDEAIAEYRTAIDLDPKLAGAHYDLGIALSKQGKQDEAIAEYRKVIEVKPDYAEAHCNLGHALSEQGKLAEALGALRRGHELGSKRPGWPYPSDAWVRQAERAVALEGKLPDFLKGAFQPKDNDERLGLIRICRVKKLYRTAARLYADAVAADPKLIDDLKAGHRYNAACYAALAGCGKGEAAAKFEEKERARWRKQALDWLRADLAVWTKRLDSGKPEDRQQVQGMMQHWQQDSDLAGIRDNEALAKLSADEQEACKKLWADVAALLKKAQAGK